MKMMLKLGMGVGLIALSAWLMSLFVPRTCAVPADLTAKAEHIIQVRSVLDDQVAAWNSGDIEGYICLLYTSPSPRDQRGSRMPSSA